MRISAFLIAAAGLLSGCISVTTQHTATPLENGENEVGLYLDTSGSLDENSSGSTVRPGIAVRRGVSPKSDIGFNANSGLIKFDYNHLLVEAVPFSINPSLGLYFVGVNPGPDQDFQTQVFIWPELGVLLDAVALDNFFLTLGVRPGFAVASESGAGFGGESSSSTAFGGTAVLLARIEAGPIAIIPEFDIFHYRSEGEGSTGWTFALGLHF